MKAGHLRRLLHQTADPRHRRGRTPVYRGRSEIDMPGHMTAALASYPELDARGPYAIPAAVRRDILRGQSRGLRFRGKVLEEVIGLFLEVHPHRGDECRARGGGSANASR
ncbi:MAG: family 20 glycosylhydrolase [Alistipes finegoldii]